MIFPGLTDIPAVMFGEQGTELFVRDFGGTHPKTFLNLCFEGR